MTADPDAAQVVGLETSADHLGGGKVQPMLRSCRPWASQSELGDSSGQFLGKAMLG